MTKNKKLLSLTSVLLIICLALGAVVLTSSILGYGTNTDITKPNTNAVPTAYTPISEAEVVKDGRVSTTYSPEANQLANYPDHTLVAVSDASQLTTEVVSNASNYIYLTDNITVTGMSILGDFGGVFDGNGKTVTMDITAATNTWYSGGFVNTLSGAIINTTFDVVKYSNGVGNGSDSYHGVIAYQLATTAIIDNIYVDLIYSPTAVGVDTSGPYIWTDIMHEGGGVKAIYLAGIAGEALGGSIIRNSTVNNNAGNAGFYATTWIANGYGLFGASKTYTNTYVSAFIGFSRGATLSNITYTGSGATTVSSDSGNKKENTAHLFGIVGNASGSSVTINGLNYAYTGAFTYGAGITTGKSQQAMFVREGTLSIANIYVAEKVGYTSKVGIYGSSGKLSAVQYSDEVELVDMAGDDTVFKVKGNADNSPVWTISNNGAEVEGAYVDLYKLQADEYAYVKSPLNLSNVGAITTDTPTMYYVEKISGTASTYSVGDTYNTETTQYEASKVYDGHIPSGAINFAMDTNLASTEYYASQESSANVGTYVYTLREEVKADFNSENVLFDVENRIVFRNAEFNINANLEWTVTPRPITLNVDNKNIVYGDELNNEIFTMSSVGELDPVGTANFNVISVLNGETGYNGTTSAGTTFTVTVEVEMSDGNSNYDITLNQGTLTVIKRDVSINSTIADRDYDNTAITQSYEYAEGVIVNGYDAILEVTVEWLQGEALLEQAPTNAGDYTLRYTFLDNGEIANYNNAVITYDFSINKRAIDIDYSATQGKWYTDGIAQTADYAVGGVNEEDTTLINGLTSIAYYTSPEHTDLADTSVPGIYYAVVTFAGADNYAASTYDITLEVSRIKLIAELLVDDSVVFTYGDNVNVSDSTEVFIMLDGGGSYNNISESDIYRFYTTMTDGAVNVMGNNVGDYSIYIAINEEYAHIFDLAEIEFAGNFSIIPADATITLNSEDKTSHTALENIANIDFNSYFVSEGVNGETPNTVITYIDAENNEVDEITAAGYYTVKASLNDSNYNAVSNSEYTFFVAGGYQTYVDGDIKFELSLDKLTISTTKTKTFICLENSEEFISLDQPLVIDITAQASYSFTVRMDIDYDLSLEGIDPFEVTYDLNEVDVLALINGFDLEKVKVSQLSTMEKVFAYADILVEASEDFNTAYTALRDAYTNKINAINSAITDVVDSASGIIAQGEEA